jgi:tRNA nucleotidyltransferase (CCA-adding enzyme)
MNKGIYRVGGSVRDLLMGREPKDHDFVVVGMTPAEFLSLWPQARAIGNSFPVYMIKENGITYEFAFARRERKIGIGHNGFEVDYDPSVTLEEDLERRDLTMNAIALPGMHDGSGDLAKAIIDPFGGYADIKAGIIRHVSPAFSEDPLRVYRVARFAAQIGFRVADETYGIAQKVSQRELEALSGERVLGEMDKAMRSPRPSRFFNELAFGVGGLGAWFYELVKLIGTPAGPPGHHDELDAFTHTMMVLDYATDMPTGDIDPVVVRYAALLHDLGKGVTPREEWPRHLNHEENGVYQVEKFCNRLKMPAKIKEAAQLASSEHLKVHRFLEMRKGKMVDLIRRADRTVLKAEGLAMVAMADAMGREALVKRLDGPKALLATAEPCRDETGHPIPGGLEGEQIGLHIRNRKGVAVRRILREQKFIGQHKANT